jgi:hypothetical protein
MSRKHVEALVGRLNAKLGRPATAYTRGADGALKSNDGHMFVDYYNPGGNRCAYKLAEISGQQGAESSPVGYRRLGLKDFEVAVDYFAHGVQEGLKLRESQIYKVAGHLAAWAQCAESRQLRTIDGPEATALKNQAENFWALVAELGYCKANFE